MAKTAWLRYDDGGAIDATLPRKLVTSTAPDNWLLAIFQEAEASGWCTKPYCTTCGSLEFRRAYWSHAAWQAGVATHGADSTRARDFPSEFTSAECRAIVLALIAGLRQLPESHCQTTGFRVIICDTHPPFLRFGVAIDLESELASTPAGSELARMHEHSDQQRDESDRHVAYMSPEAVAERRRLAREQRASAHAARQAATRRANRARQDLLESLAELPTCERLARFATDLTLNLDSVPRELIPGAEIDLVGFDPAKAAALLVRIDRRRRGWGHLRRLLERRLASPPADTGTEGA